MIVEYCGSDIKMPDFLIVGAPRSGTTTLYSCLCKHPHIFMSEEKEPMFFIFLGKDRSFQDSRLRKIASYTITDLEDYLRLFRHANERDTIGEASSWYLYDHETVLRNVKRIYGNKAKEVKVIMILRDPADRAWSHFCLKRALGEEHLGFEEAIHPETIRFRLQNGMVPGFDYIGMGMYSRQVKTYIENFSHVKILLFEDIVRDLPERLTEIFRFLGLEPVSVCQGEIKLNVSGRPKNRLAVILDRLVYKPNVLKSFVKTAIPFRARKRLKYSMGSRIYEKETLDKEIRKRLVNIYRHDILLTEKLINRDLGHWRSA